MESERKQEHKRMMNILWKDKTILAKALGINPEKIFYRDMEYQFDNLTDERADLVFQDKFDPYRGDMTATCFVLELKSENIDHEVLGQLKKAVDSMDCLGKSIKHWGYTVGIAVGKKITKSGLDILSDGPYYVFLWNENNNIVRLRPVGKTYSPPVTKKAFKRKKAKKL